MQRFFLLLILQLFCVILLQAQTNKKLSFIDQNLQACLDSSENYSTAGQIQCAARAIEAWNREMNRYYKLLMGLLSPDEKTKLKKAQVAWLGFRDHEMTFQGTTYNNLEGSMWRVAAVYRQLEIVKQRATDLAEYYNVFSENKGPATKNK